MLITAYLSSTQARSNIGCWAAVTILKSLLVCTETSLWLCACAKPEHGLHQSCNGLMSPSS